MTTIYKVERPFSGVDWILDYRTLEICLKSNPAISANESQAQQF